jgi:chaperonin GroES
MVSPKVGFIPAPGYILIDPIEKDKKSSTFAIQDAQDVPHKGTVLAVGPAKKDKDGNIIESPVKEGDFALYSVMGHEEFKMEYEGDLRHRFVIVPFERILGTFEK